RLEESFDREDLVYIRDTAQLVLKSILDRLGPLKSGATDEKPGRVFPEIPRAQEAELGNLLEETRRRERDLVKEIRRVRRRGEKQDDTQTSPHPVEVDVVSVRRRHGGQK